MALTKIDDVDLVRELNLTNDVTTNGVLTFVRSNETVGFVYNANGTVNFDLSQAAIWYCINPAADFRANFTNAAVANNNSNTSFTVALICKQGATQGLPVSNTPTVVNRSSNSITINTQYWGGGNIPTASAANTVDIVTFSFLPVDRQDATTNTGFICISSFSSYA